MMNLQQLALQLISGGAMDKNINFFQVNVLTIWKNSFE
jgi:hypothetical protein